jgi:hypothetical protein
MGKDSLPKDAISIRKELPPSHERVLGFVSDRSVAIEHFPLVLWRDYSNEWWGGLPGNYLDLRALKWKITHWKRLDSPHGR